MNLRTGFCVDIVKSKLSNDLSPPLEGQLTGFFNFVLTLSSFRKNTNASRLSFHLYTNYKTLASLGGPLSMLALERLWPGMLFKMAVMQ